MNIIAFDTSSDAAVIALETEKTYEERIICGAFSPSENLLHEMECMLKRAGITIKDINMAAVTKGPGSFTGLRIAMASAKGLASALSIPLVSVPTLNAIAGAVSFYSGAVLSCIDAKKKRFYLQLRKGNDIIIPDFDGNAEDIIGVLSSLDMPVLVTGPDAVKFSSKLSEAGFSNYITDTMAPRSIGRALISLAKRKLEEEGPDDIGEGPVYIRRSDAEEALLRKMEEKENG